MSDTMSDMKAVGTILPSCLMGTGPWCKSVLLYSPDNLGDSPEKRITLYIMQEPQKQTSAQEPRTCNGQIVTPMSVKPELYSNYYTPAPSNVLGYDMSFWLGTSADQANFDKNLVHATKESAILHSTAMQILTRY